MNQPKILIAAPTHYSKAYCQFDWIEQLSLLHYDNYQVYLSDNSPDDSFAKAISAYGVECARVNPKGKSVMEALAESHEQCRRKAIEINADYLLHWEVDIFNSYRSLINQLVVREKVVVGALYHINHGVDSHLSVVVRYNKHHYEPATTLMLSRGADMAFVDGQCKQVAHIGLGCVLIHKSVFERISFRPDPKQRTWPDTCFAEDCHYHNVPIFADTSLIMQHRNKKRA